MVTAARVPNDKANKDGAETCLVCAKGFSGPDGSAEAAAVQCDECLSWIHLQCEKVREEDLSEKKYFCLFRCRGIRLSTLSAKTSASDFFRTIRSDPALSFLNSYPDSVFEDIGGEILSGMNKDLFYDLFSTLSSKHKALFFSMVSKISGKTLFPASVMAITLP